VLLVDDHDLFRYGLRELLVEQGFDVVGDAASGELAVSLALRHEPDVVVMDLSMPGIGGVEATRELAARVPGARVLVLTIASGDQDVNDAIVAGAVGYLLKDAAPEEIAVGIRAAAVGEALVSPRVAAGLLDGIRSRGDQRWPEDALKRLSRREVEVLRLLGSGRNNADIARELHITAATAKNHVASILGKLGLENRIEAAVYAARAGLL
jgi:DNA-binding NarL/FixJ family response regulator